ncbi:hypothetical protein [Rhizorhabdus wittichii]
MMNQPLFTTIDGLKRRAKRLKKEQGIRHAQALDAVAVAGGYQNYAHALRMLGGPGDD